MKPNFKPKLLSLVAVIVLAFEIFFPAALAIRGPHLRLFDAIADHNVPLMTINQLLDDHPDWINLCDDAGRLPIHAAAEARRLDVVKMLIEERGVGVNTPGPHGGLTPLWFAISEFDFGYYNDASISEYLVSRGANIGVTNRCEGSILHLFSNIFGPISIRFLYNAFKDKCDFGSVFGLETLSRTGETPLGHALREHHYKTAMALIEIGADVKHKNENGEEPLFALMEYGLLPQYPDQDELTQVVDAMVQRGADLNCKNINGDTLYDYATEARGYGDTREHACSRGKWLKDYCKARGIALQPGKKSLDYVDSIFDGCCTLL